MPANTARIRVLSLYKRLFKHFGPQHWWPADSPWEMMVGAFLTQNTSWTNVEKAIAALKKSNSLSVRKIAHMPRRRLEKLIRPSGYFRQKSRRLQLFAREMLRDPAFYTELCGSKPPSPRAHAGPLPVGEGAARPGEGTYLRERLLALHGIGPETADAILLYAAGLPVFVVDAYTRRIGQRFGLLSKENYAEIQALFQERLPRDAALYNEFHALMVRLAKMICTKRNPRCGICPVMTRCNFAALKRN